MRNLQVSSLGSYAFMAHLTILLLSPGANFHHRGVRDHKGRKEMKKAYQKSQQQPAPSTDLATPSTIARTSSSESEKGRSNSSNSPGSSVAEMDGEPVVSSSIAEKMDDGRKMPAHIPEKMNDEHNSMPSEIDGTPIDTLPRYSELESPR